MFLVTRERRGSSFNKFADRWLGAYALWMLAPLILIKRLFSSFRTTDGPSLVVCFGAIGDLVILTEAVRALSAHPDTVLACSRLNQGVAKVFNGVFKSTEIVDLHNPFSLLRVCRKYNVSKVFDSTQWANIGPLQVGLAKLLGPTILTVGFRTNSMIRNTIYDKVVNHRRDVHEFLNFMNLLKAKEVHVSNGDLPLLLPHLYEGTQSRLSRKLLFHMWPSGNRSHLKEWPEENWKRLIGICVQEGYTVYLSGSPEDSAKIQLLAQGFNKHQVCNLAGKFTLSQLFSFLADEIELVVSVNTGILHLAVAASVPVIGLHGGVNPVRWGPLGGRSVSLLPQSGNMAYLHYGFEYPKDDQEAYVLDRLTVQQVVDAIQKMSNFLFDSVS